ncbi:hypothetical protein AKJ64_05150 [candidate division MSBL1 archaeon SCGC-AAA259E17]|uniref:Uncharacterized protein n=1 Tax=candidate division MSBL1 archaeon SCGC-AAA259E17 TaxID=1698263 RepID=A0A133U9N4_9EURY|nr:hypothetical protein AKJ64_05150 [candidate division MSBL1 archaeon SCGC-AAA259E17]
MQVYFSHPTFTYQTDTEEFCVDMIRENFNNVKEVVNPLEYGLKKNVRKIIRESDVVVGMAISGKYTFLVHNEMEDGRKGGADLYTIRVQNKEKIGKIEKGMPEEIRKLSRKESNRYTKELMKENRESFWSLLLGKHNTRF